MDILPDSRTRVVRGLTWHAGWGCMTVPIYCAHCAKQGGFVPEETCTFAFWLCDDCFASHGTITGTFVTPDEAFWSKLAADRGESVAGPAVPFSR